MNNIEILEHIAIAYIDDEEFSQYVSPEGRFITNKQLAQAIENLIQENKELKDKNMKMAVNGGSISAMYYIEENYIQKSKLKEKIEELNKEMLKEENSLELFYRKKYCKEFLQELLGDKE